MAVKPLSQLFKEADRFLGPKDLAKVASAAAPAIEDVSGLAQSGNENIDQVEFEKMAMALNRAEALIELEALQKLSNFEKQAHAEGYKPEQIEEALRKIAAQHMKKNLETFVDIQKTAASSSIDGKKRSTGYGK